MYEEDCGYFAGKTADVDIYAIPTPEDCRDLCKAPADADNSDLQRFYFEVLLEQGFRRSGNCIYYNNCPLCRKCIPIRLDVRDFQLTKSQRYNVRKNHEISVKMTVKPEEMITEEKMDLFRKYFARHDQSADNITEGNLRNHLMNLNGIDKNEDGKLELQFKGTINLDYYDGDKLVGVSVLDTCNEAVSSNYFYYDITPEEMKKGIGTYSILYEIQFCRIYNYRYYYLGYYIHECRKMNYKKNFKPCQLRIGEEWKLFSECSEDDLTGKSQCAKAYESVKTEETDMNADNA